MSATTKEVRPGMVNLAIELYLKLQREERAQEKAREELADWLLVDVGDMLECII